MTPAPPAPLEADDPTRAALVKRKIGDRLRDVERHLRALRTAMAQFGEDFDREEFAKAFASADPDDLNRVKAVERGVDQLFNWMVELSALGLELAGVRARDAEPNSRRDLDSLRRAGVLSRERTDRLQRLRELRRLVVHEYATATAAQVHEAAWIVADDLTVFYDAYAKWIRQGFAVPARRASDVNG